MNGSKITDACTKKLLEVQFTKKRILNSFICQSFLIVHPLIFYSVANFNQIWRKNKGFNDTMMLQILQKHSEKKSGQCYHWGKSKQNSVVLSFERHWPISTCALTGQCHCALMGLLYRKEGSPCLKRGLRSEFDERKVSLLTRLEHLLFTNSNPPTSHFAKALAISCALHCTEVHCQNYAHAFIQSQFINI